MLGGQFNGGRMVTEAVSLMEGEWSQGWSQMEGEWSCYRGGH